MRMTSPSHWLKGFCCVAEQFACPVAWIVFAQWELVCKKHSKDRKLHFEKCTKRLAKTRVIFFQIINIHLQGFLTLVFPSANLSKICNVLMKNALELAPTTCFVIGVLRPIPRGLMHECRQRPLSQTILECRDYCPQIGMCRRRQVKVTDPLT